MIPATFERKMLLSDARLPIVDKGGVSWDYDAKNMHIRNNAMMVQMEHHPTGHAVFIYVIAVGISLSLPSLKLALGLSCALVSSVKEKLDMLHVSAILGERGNLPGWPGRVLMCRETNGHSGKLPPEKRLSWGDALQAAARLDRQVPRPSKS